MSQYRDDRAASNLRIQALEVSVSERDAEIARHRASLAERDEEIFRLQRELDLAGGGGPRRARSVNAAWASRIVGAATGLALAAAGVGVTAMRSPAAVSAAPSPFFLPPGAAPIHADPFVGGTVDWTRVDPPAQGGTMEGSPASSPEPQGRTIDFKVWEAAPPPPDEDQVRRSIEARVASGRASTDEIKMLKAICSHRGDRACRDRAQALLNRARGANL